MSGGEPTARARNAIGSLRAQGGLTVTGFLSDLLLFSCLTTFITGIVIAIANLLS